MNCTFDHELSDPFVSVIVPVYNDSRRVGKCIEALLAQTYPHQRYEVLVVDNGSTDDTCAVIEKYQVTLLWEKYKQSSYGARNKGIAAARGEIIALTDSDCIPNNDWLENGVRRLLGVPNCGLIGGAIAIFFKKEDSPNAVELYDSIMGFHQKEDIEEHHFGSTANVFTFKKIFDQVGLFNDCLKSGGDNEWGRRVFSYGYRLVYADDVVVAHPARHSFGQLWKRYARLIGGCYEQYWQNSYRAHVILTLRSAKSILGVTARTFLSMHHSEKLRGIRRKVQFISVYTFIQIVSTLERTRLLLGGNPRR
jgi:glycosyltransferase involved in cell wall biosynthesis